MRIILPLLAIRLLAPLGLAGEPASALPEEVAEVRSDRAVPEPMPWVGLRVGKLDEVMRAHASSVPEGVGFLVKSVASDGPAKAAGLRRYDILWKFDDQLLVNEAQFATLLKMRKVGDEVKLSVVRCGREKVLDLVLGSPRPETGVNGISPADLPLVPSGVSGIPQVRVTPLDQTAELTRADGSSGRLSYRDGEAYVVIRSADDEVVYDGPVRKDGRFAVPGEWSDSVGAMMRSLYKANNPEWVPRRPRPRVVVPASGKDR